MVVAHTYRTTQRLIFVIKCVPRAHVPAVVAVRVLQHLLWKQDLQLAVFNVFLPFNAGVCKTLPHPWCYTLLHYLNTWPRYVNIAQWLHSAVIITNHNETRPYIDMARRTNSTKHYLVMRRSQGSLQLTTTLLPIRTSHFQASTPAIGTFSLIHCVKTAAEWRAWGQG